MALLLLQAAAKVSSAPLPSLGSVDVCRDPYCSIHRLNKNGTGHEIFARGGRHLNSAWCPLSPRH